jgi:hypothetical protein
VSHGLAAGVLCDELSRVGCAFARALEAALAGAGPADDGAAEVGDADNGVVEAGLNMGNAVADIFRTLRLDDLDGLDGVV